MNIVSDKYRQPETPTFMRMLLEAGADVNAYHRVAIFGAMSRKLTALHVACRGKYADDVKQLLEAGADANSNPQHDGFTPLISVTRSEVGFERTTLKESNP